MRRRVASIRNLSEQRVPDIRRLFVVRSTPMHDANELLDIVVKHNEPMMNGCIATKTSFQKQLGMMGSNLPSCWG